MKRFAPQDYPRCCVVGCNSSFRQRVKNKNLHFYRLGPIRKQSHERFLKWVKASNSQRTLGDNDRVCSKHFTEADFEDRDMLQRRLMPAENFIRGPCLKDSAVPHVNLQSTQRTNIETHNNITMTPAPDAFDISDSAMFDVSPTMEVFKSTPKKQQQCNFRDAATQQHKHQSPHLEPGLSSCSRASVASTLQNSASTPIRVATCPLPEPFEGQLTSDIKIEPEEFETSLVDQSDFEFPSPSRMKQEDESHDISQQGAKRATCPLFTPPSDSPELIMIKQELHDNFQQESEFEPESYPLSTPPSDFLKISLIKPESQVTSDIFDQQEVEIRTPSIDFPELNTMLKQNSNDLIQKSEIKHESYPDFIPPETIFLQEFPIDESNPTTMENDQVQNTSIENLSQFYKEKMNPGTRSNVPQVSLEEIPENKIWKCEFCTQFFAIEERLHLHISIMHKEAKSSHQFQEFYDHLCKYHVKCLNYISTMLTYSLLLEMADAGNSFPCLKCGTEFTDTESLYLHFNTEHNNYHKNKEFIRCKVCMKCHNDFKEMESHVKYEHKNYYWNHWVDEETVYCCLICEAFFAECRKKYNRSMESECSLIIKEIEVFRTFSEDCFQFKYKIIQALKIASQYFSCTICKPTNFFSMDICYSHLEAHEDLVITKCSYSSCKTSTFVNVNHFYQHIKYLCGNYRVMDFEHYKSNDTYGSDCYICSLEFVNSCSLAMHEQSIHQGTKFNVMIVDGKLTCPFCKVIFSDHKLFYAHCSPYTILFPNSSKYCEQCSLLFSTSSQFKQHCITKHNDQRCFKCKICNIGRESKTQLENHVLKEHNVQLIHCTNCLSNVRIKDNLTMEHFKNCYKSSDLYYSCPVCGLLLESFKMLIDHINFDILTLQTKVHQCKHCLNYFFSKYNLCAHVVNGKCELCNLYFCGNGNLIEHMSSQKCVAVKSAAWFEEFQ